MAELFELFLQYCKHCFAELEVHENIENMRKLIQLKLHEELLNEKKKLQKIKKTLLQSIKILQNK